MFRIACAAFLAMMCAFAGNVQAQGINEYVVKKAVSPITIDGRLSEPEWEEAALTERFVYYVNGSATVLSTQGKMLWDDQYLYVAFICEDPDVWATLKNHDDHLWNEEVAEMFIDPDGDGLNYLELQVNPLGTLMDLLMSKAYSDGGKSDFDWNLNGFTAGIFVDGTLNDINDNDIKWVCEVRLPFENMAFSAPAMDFPPKDGDSWRLNLYRYDYGGDDRKDTELSAWNRTDSRGFHAPDKFGRIIFSQEPVISPTKVNDAETVPAGFGISGNYPNPFNPSTRIDFHLPADGSVNLDIYNVLGQHIRSLIDGNCKAGNNSIVWDGRDTSGNSVNSGIYFSNLKVNSQVSSHRMLLMK
ncbi:unnamed protein product [marine sediment metagenome]|uniref:FlgD Ig-like domain-containing protein n=1 Tax=marine sediment metagenome TaxID=412755 RepID=X0S0U7_9ZZZZ